MSFNLKKYPLDITGISNNNLIIDEKYNLVKQTNLDYKVIVLNHGHFFSDSLILRYPDGELLERNVDYQVTGFSDEAYRMTGKPIHSLIVINCKLKYNDVLISVQLLGGKFENVGNVIKSKLKGLANTTRKLKYSNIKDIPDVVTLNKHMHPYWDLYNFTDRTNVLRRMTSGLQNIVNQEIFQIKTNYDENIEGYYNEKSNLDSRYKEHKEDLDNPHKTTKAQVGLGNVKNGDIGVDSDMNVIDFDYESKYLTPHLMNVFLEKHFFPILTEHDDDKNNPHRVTAHQVGSYPRGEITITDGLYYNRGETTRRTNRLGGTKDSNFVTVNRGKTFAALYDTLMSDLDAAEIRSGYLTLKHLTKETPQANAVMITKNDGTLSWLNYTQINSLFNPQPIKIYRAGVTVGSGTNLANYARSLRNPANEQEGTIMIFNMYNRPYSESGNGTAYYYYYYGLAVTAVRNGVWVY